MDASDSTPRTGESVTEEPAERYDLLRLAVVDNHVGHVEQRLDEAREAVREERVDDAVALLAEVEGTAGALRELVQEASDYRHAEGVERREE